MLEVRFPEDAVQTEGGARHGVFGFAVAGGQWAILNFLCVNLKATKETWLSAQNICQRVISSA